MIRDDRWRLKNYATAISVKGLKPCPECFNISGKTPVGCMKVYAMLKRSLIFATFGGVIGIATSALAATPAAPVPTMTGSPSIAGSSTSDAMASPSIQQVQWHRGPGWGWGPPPRWHRSNWRNRRWWGGRWHYW